MSIVLNGTTQYAYCVTPVTAYPYSVSAWMRTTDLDQNAVIAGITADDSGHQNFAHFRGSIAGDYVAASTYATGWGVAASTSGVSSATWHHVLVVFNSSADRRVYIDGGSKGTDVTDQNAVTTSHLVIGCRFPGTPSLFFGGNIAEVAVWNIALADADAVTLAGGANSKTVEAGNLLDYWQLKTDGNSNHSGTNLTGVAAPTYDSEVHPTVDSPITYVDLAGTSGIAFSGTGGLTNLASLSGSSTIAFSGTGTLTFGPLSGTKAEKYTKRLITIGADALWYESI